MNGDPESESQRADGSEGGSARRFFEVSPDSRPILTASVCVLCVFIFLGLNQPSIRNSPEEYARFGISSGSAIRSGAVWALLTSSVAHVELWHLVFNLYWLWRFGAVLERTLGRARWLVLYLALAFISSSAQLTVTGETGIGASGVVYGFFGFMWIAARNVPAFKEVIKPGVVQLFLTWLVLCFALTYLNILPVANAAHLVGLFAGSLAATFLSGRKPLAVAGIATLATASCLGLFWAPWTSSWTSDKALKAYEKGDFNRADHWTRRSLENGADKAWCWATLMRIATAQHNRKSYTDALENLKRTDPAAAERTEKEMRSFW